MTTQLTRIESNTLLIVDLLRALYRSMDVGFAGTGTTLARIEGEVNGGIELLTAVSARVIVPKRRDIHTGKDLNMPQNVANDVVTVFPVEFDNLAGMPVPAPAGGSITVSLVDGAGAPSTLGTVALEPDGTSFAVTPTLPAGSALGDASVKYDDTVNGGTPSDISFTFDITFTADTAASSAHVDVAHISTRPLPVGP